LVHWQIPSFRLSDHVLRAILAIPAAGFDLDMWNAVLEEEEIEQQLDQPVI
jgi:hypothetical protein